MVGRSAKTALHLKFEALLAESKDPTLEGLWIDYIGRDEPTYIDASLARRKSGLPPLKGRRTLSADQDLEADWDAVALRDRDHVTRR